jgi:DNA-binding NarL/FixJ family response regulator
VIANRPFAQRLRPTTNAEHFRLALGHRNRTIVQEPHISESTVKFHVANILAKLSVGSRGEAAAFFHSAAAV